MSNLDDEKENISENHVSDDTQNKDEEIVIKSNTILTQKSVDKDEART